MFETINIILIFLQFFKHYHQTHFFNWVENEQLQRQKTHHGMCDTQPKCILGKSSALIITEYEIKNLGTSHSPYITQSVACENSRFSWLFAAGDFSRRGTSATQKLHTDDVNQC